MKEITMKFNSLFLMMLILLLAACGGGTIIEPTSEPTAAPTSAPTAEPTAEPTALPTPTAEPTAEPTAGLINPAWVFCVEEEGRLGLESRPDGMQFGVCYYMDNRQCEVWAMYRGDCPVTGLRITGYITEAGRFCAINGGQYDVTVEGDMDTEQGTCTLPDGLVCDAQAFYEGSCGPAPGPTTED